MLQIPGGDAEEYWNWSGRIADGDWISSTPFLSAPLYPYVLALLRAGGGGLLAAYLMQVLLRSLTAFLLYRAATQRFGHPGYGLASALLFLLLVEPAFYASRLLNCEIQLALLAGLLLACPLDAAQRTRGRLAATGLLLGLNVLANPSMLLLLPALPLWLGWRPRRGLEQTGLVAACALLMIAPATLHNYLATRATQGGAELILVSAQSGITYAHGNGPGAIGVYYGLPGVSQLRLVQNQEAYAAAAAATGRPGWKSADRYFRGQAVDWLLANPAAAVELHLRKLAYLFVGQDYGDLYNVSLEARDAALPNTVPPHSRVQTGWILPAALAGALIFLRRRGRAAAPDAALLLLPCLIVILFWFSPRYRMPLIPAACLLAPFGLVQIARLANRRMALAGLAVLILIPAAGRAAAATSGFDNAERYRPEYEYHLGHQLWKWRRHEAAIERLTRALAAGFEPATVLETRGRSFMDLGDAAARANQKEEALRNYRASLADFSRCLELDPLQLDVWITRGNLLNGLGQREQARRDLEEAARLADARQDSALAAQIRARIAHLDAAPPPRQ